jgi:hypothetical protein
MRRLAIVLLMAGATLSATPTGASDASVPLVSAGRGLSVRLPRGWHLIRSEAGPDQGSRRSLLRPAVMASFAVRFARRPCPCASPNYRTCGVWCEETGIRDWPAAGALVFVWEFPSPRNPADLGRGYRLRPARFLVAQDDPQFAVALSHELRALDVEAGHACVEGPGSHPSWWSDFRDAGRVFQAEVYLGPAAGPAVRARTDALLDSLRVTPLRSD